MAVTKYMMTNEILKSIVQKSIDKFNNSEKLLIENDFNERAICSKFVIYLEYELSQNNYSNYKVNTEYNRGMNGNLSNTKKLNGKSISIDLAVNKMVYSEPYGFDNLICIEMKKRTASNKEIEEDKIRLNKLTDIKEGFCYKAGFLIIVDSRNASSTFGLKILEEYYLH